MLWIHPRHTFYLHLQVQYYRRSSRGYNINIQNNNKCEDVLSSWILRSPQGQRVDPLSKWWFQDFEYYANSNAQAFYPILRHQSGDWYLILRIWVISDEREAQNKIKLTRFHCLKWDRQSQQIILLFQWAPLIIGNTHQSANKTLVF
jgi:hypothetical protein